MCRAGADPHNVNERFGMDDLVVLALLGVVALVGAAGAYLEHRRRGRKRQDLARLLERDRRMTITATPCGLDEQTLAVGYEVCPAGDRKRGVRYGVSGPTRVELSGTPQDVECAAFQWFWEVRTRTRSATGQRHTRHEEMRTTVGAIAMPTTVLRRILIRPESPLGRTGLTRGGIQVESDEFNRRFRVESNDRELAVQLLDPGVQRLLLEAFTGRSIELRGTTLLLEGTPTHRDDSLTGVIGELPAVRQDVRRLLAAVPPQFWRAAQSALPD